MGLTIVQRSDLRVRKTDAKVALVLAGGAVSGGAYKVGGLKALNDYLLNRKVTDFDIYVGLSAGAFLAAPLATGITPEEMLRSLDGKSSRYSQLGLLDFYNPNFKEILLKPLKGIYDLAAFAPRMGMKVLKRLPGDLRTAFYGALKVLAVQDDEEIRELADDIQRDLLEDLSLPNPLSYLPSGLFDNESLERYVRRNLDDNDMTNDFVTLERQTGKSLYILATHLDTAQRVVFGPDENNSVTISEAIQASTALPGFYKPARLNGQDYIDGGVCKTANMSIAVEHGADLIICYNPFRPFYNHVETVRDAHTGKYVRKGRPLSTDGLVMVLNQVFRTLLRSRLQASVRRYREDPNFDGDIILVEPTDYDYKFFEMNPVAFWERVRAARHGFESVKKSIEREHRLVRRILSSYGIEMTRKYIQDDMRQFERYGHDEAAVLDVLQTEKPKLDIRVMGGGGS